MQTKARLLASGALLLAAAIGTSAHAQSKATTAAAAAASTNTIEELVVTAEKRAQNLQDVPVAISAFTSEKRDLIGINTIQDMTNFTPGLNYTSANDRTTIRGIGRLSNAHAIAVPVAVYDDGIYTTSTVTAGKTPIFTDRVEVLRGPQGTLYGRNSLGGAINVISRRPTEDLYAEVRATVANYGRTLVEGAISGPLEPGLQFRLAGNWEKQRDGYFKNLVPGMPSEGGVIDQFFLEGQLQAKFGDHADAWLKVFTAGWNNGSGGPGARAGYTTGPIGVGEFGGQNVTSGFACAPGGVVINVVNTNPLGCVNPANNDPHTFATNFAQTVSLDETYGLSFQFAYHFDGFDVKYIAGGLNYHYTLDSDNGGGSIKSLTIPIRAVNGAANPVCSALFQAIGVCGPLTIFPRQSSTYQEDYHNFSHELNIASTGTGPFQWIGGLYYYKEGIKQPVFTTLHDQPQMDGPITAAVPSLTGPVGLDFQRHLYDDRPIFHQESYAAYGQVDWKFTDTLKLTLGLRYNHDREYGTESVRVLCFATTACGTTPESLGTLTPVVDVTAAVAYTGGGQNIVPQGVVPNGNLGGVVFTSDGFATRAYDATWTATTGTAGLQWDPDRDTMFYATYGRGYLAGGFASGITSTLGQFPYTGPEHVNHYEIGMKKEFFDRTLQVNLSIFHDDIDGYQAPLTVVNNTGGLAVSQSRFLNIPKAVSQGVELEAIWQPIDHLSFTLSYGFNDAYIQELTNIIDGTDPLALDPKAKPTGQLASIDAATGQPQRPQNLKGNQLPQAPRNRVALNANYTWVLEQGSLTPSISYVWRDKQYSGLFTRDIQAAPSWDQWDGRVTWKSKDNKYSIIAYVKNIGDTLGYDGGAGASRIAGSFYPSTLAALGLTAGNPVSASPACAKGAGPLNPNCAYNAVQGFSKSYALTPPRTFGLEVQYRF